MYPIILDGRKPQRPSERTPEQAMTFPAIVTHDGQYQLKRRKTGNPRMPFQWNWYDSRDGSEVLSLPCGYNYALQFARWMRWRIYGGERHETTSLIQQWKTQPHT